jgi:hypothetical protein
LLRFAQADLEKLELPELRRLRNQVMGWMKAVRPTPNTTHRMPLRPLSFVWLDVGVQVTNLTVEHLRAALTPLQGHARAAITALRQPGREWRVPALRTSLVFERGKVRRVVTSQDGTPEPIFVATVADVLLANWDAVRVCDAPNCTNLFVPNDGRGKYCSPQCGQDTRWSRFAQKRVRDYAAEYERRQRRQVGANVRIKHRPKRG